ncbi:MAG: hypothetical protein ABJO86_00640 [Lentilitoribacter sp.]
MYEKVYPGFNLTKSGSPPSGLGKLKALAPDAIVPTTKVLKSDFWAGVKTMEPASIYGVEVDLWRILAGPTEF